MTRPLSLAALESFYIGGHTRPVTGAFGPETQSSGQMYVQRMTPAEKTFPIPVVFIHGGSHTGVCWETTPDGREGWQTLFVRSGFETLVIDQAWRGRSAPDLTGLNPMVPDREAAPVAMTCGDALVAHFVRGSQFDPAWTPAYIPQIWPDFYVPTAIGKGMPGESDPRALGPMLDLVDKLGRVVLVTHSQGAELGWQTACARPDKVAAIFAIEPAQTVPGLDDPRLSQIPVRLMWGDNLPSEGHVLTTRDVALARELASSRPTVTVDFLPENGVFENGHMLMMEKNNAILADRVMSWLKALKLPRP